MKVFKIVNIIFIIQNIPLDKCVPIISRNLNSHYQGLLCAKFGLTLGVLNDVYVNVYTVYMHAISQSFFVELSA